MVAISLQCPGTALSLLCSVNWFVDALDLTLNGWFDINWKLSANGHFTGGMSEKFSVEELTVIFNKLLQLKFCMK